MVDSLTWRENEADGRETRELISDTPGPEADREVSVMLATAGLSGLLAVLLIVLVLLIVSEYSFIADHFPGAGMWAQGLIGARH